MCRKSRVKKMFFSITRGGLPIMENSIKRMFFLIETFHYLVPENSLWFRKQVYQVFTFPRFHVFSTLPSESIPNCMLYNTFAHIVSRVVQSQTNACGKACHLRWQSSLLFSLHAVWGSIHHQTM